MGKFTISKLISIIIFLVTFFMFLIWMINYSTDIAILFGFRMSNVVANDLAGRISSLASVSGEATSQYILGSKSESQGAIYDVTIRNYIVCVKSVASSTLTSDCASHNFALEFPFSEKSVTYRKLTIEKFYDTDYENYKIRVKSEAA